MISVPPRPSLFRERASRERRWYVHPGVSKGGWCGWIRGGSCATFRVERREWVGKGRGYFERPRYVQSWVGGGERGKIGILGSLFMSHVDKGYTGAMNVIIGSIIECLLGCFDQY